MSKFDLVDMLAERPLRFGENSATGWDHFDYAPGQPNLFLLSRFKQLLVREFGLEAGFDRYCAVVRPQAHSSLKRLDLKSHYTYSKEHGTSFRETITPGRRFSILPPRVIGHGDHKPIRGVTRSFYISSLENVIVRGRSSIVETATCALADFQGEELARIDDEVEFDGAVFHRDGDSLWLIESPQPKVEIDDAISLLGCHTDFFGDWLCESLTRYVAATLNGELSNRPILIDAHIPKTHRQSLELMLTGNPRIIEVEAFQPVRVGRLWWAPSLAYMPFHQILNDRFKWDYLGSSARDFAPIEQEMMRRADLVDAPASGPTRVFLARKAFRHRHLVNSAEIEAIASACGFAIIYAEELDFRAQACLLRRARYVVAPEGSSLFLRVFMGRRAKLCILNHQRTDGLTLYGGRPGPDFDKDIELTIITGPEAGERRGRSQDMNYWIDPDVFRDFLLEWFGTGTAECVSRDL